MTNWEGGAGTAKRSFIVPPAERQTGRAAEREAVRAERARERCGERWPTLRERGLDLRDRASPELSRLLLTWARYRTRGVSRFETQREPLCCCATLGLCAKCKKVSQWSVSSSRLRTGNREASVYRSSTASSNAHLNVDSSAALNLGGVVSYVCQQECVDIYGTPCRVHGTRGMVCAVHLIRREGRAHYCHWC